jgi:hypothetical protein
MFLPEREDVIECINDDTDEDHESLNSMPELEESDEEDDAVNQGTYTSTPYASIDGSWATYQVRFDRRIRGVLTHHEVAWFMLHMDHMSAHDTRQYFVTLPSLFSHATTATLEPLGNDEGAELSWTGGHLPRSDYSPPGQGPLPNGGG